MDAVFPVSAVLSEFFGTPYTFVSHELQLTD